MVATDENLDMATLTVADIALKFPNAVEILNRSNLDFCCNGKKLFVEVCGKAKLDANRIWHEVLEQHSMLGADNRMRFDTWEPALLIDFIIQHHHQFVRQAIPSIRELLNKVCNVHGSDAPELLTIRTEFDELAGELLDHLVKEEGVVFPAMKKLTELQHSGSDGVKNLQVPIDVLVDDHTHAGDLIKSIRARTKQYTPPAHACPTFQLTYKMLQEFDSDLMQHIHLENNVLFPKVLTF